MNRAGDWRYDYHATVEASCRFRLAGRQAQRLLVPRGRAPWPSRDRSASAPARILAAPDWRTDPAHGCSFLGKLARDGSRCVRHWPPLHHCCDGTRAAGPVEPRAAFHTRRSPPVREAAPANGARRSSSNCTFAGTVSAAEADAPPRSEWHGGAALVRPRQHPTALCVAPAVPRRVVWRVFRPTASRAAATHNPSVPGETPAVSSLTSVPTARQVSSRPLQSGPAHPKALPCVV